MKIMIVDDNSFIREFIRDTFLTASDGCIECSDGLQAVELYRKFRPDWVLMDIFMEKTDGIAATREILSQDPRAKIIIMTGHKERELVEKAESAGAVGYVLKENLEDIERIIKAKQN